LVRTGGDFLKLNSIGRYQGYDPVKIGKDTEDARGWSLDKNVVFIYLALIVKKLKSLWNRWRGSTASQDQNQQRYD
jgi:hypothetical protein